MKTKAVDDFYDAEAARLAAEAARVSPQPSAPPSKPVEAPSYIPPVLLDEPQRPPLRPEPPINQNLDLPAGDVRSRPARTTLEADGHPAFTIARMTAWILLAPWYLAMLAASVAVLVLFVRDLLGL